MYFFPFIMISVPSILHLPRYSSSLRAAARMGRRRRRSYSVSSLYRLSINMPVLRFLLHDRIQSASLLKANLMAIGLPLVGL